MFGPALLRAEFGPTSHNSGYRSNKAGQGISTSQTPDGDDQNRPGPMEFPKKIGMVKSYAGNGVLENVAGRMNVPHIIR